MCGQALMHTLHAHWLTAAGVGRKGAKHLEGRQHHGPHVGRERIVRQLAEGLGTLGVVVKDKDRLVLNVDLDEPLGELQ